MRVSNSHLQQLAIFTTVLTGGGVGTMYYLLQQKFTGSDWHRMSMQKLEACPAAMESLGVPPLKVYNIHLTDRHNRVDQDTAQGQDIWTIFGAALTLPSHVDESGLTSSESESEVFYCQIKIHVAGSKTGGCLYTSSVRDSNTNRWSLEQAVLNLRGGQTINLLSPPSAAAAQQTKAAGQTQGLETGDWS